MCTDTAAQIQFLSGEGILVSDDKLNNFFDKNTQKMVIEILFNFLHINTRCVDAFKYNIKFDEYCREVNK